MPSGASLIRVFLLAGNFCFASAADRVAVEAGFWSGQLKVRYQDRSERTLALLDGRFVFDPEAEPIGLTEARQVHAFYSPHRADSRYTRLVDRLEQDFPALRVTRVSVARDPPAARQPSSALQRARETEASAVRDAAEAERRVKERVPRSSEHHIHEAREFARYLLREEPARVSRALPGSPTTESLIARTFPTAIDQNRNGLRISVSLARPVRGAPIEIVTMLDQSPLSRQTAAQTLKKFEEAYRYAVVRDSAGDWLGSAGRKLSGLFVAPQGTPTPDARAIYTPSVRTLIRLTPGQIDRVEEISRMRASVKDLEFLTRALAIAASKNEALAHHMRFPARWGAIANGLLSDRDSRFEKGLADGWREAWEVVALRLRAKVQGAVTQIHEALDEKGVDPNFRSIDFVTTDLQADYNRRLLGANGIGLRFQNLDGSGPSFFLALDPSSDMSLVGGHAATLAKLAFENRLSPAAFERIALVPRRGRSASNGVARSH